MRVRIRPAVAGDAAVLHELAKATFPLACPPETTTAAIEDFIERQLSETSFAGYIDDVARELYLALDDGGVAIGYTMLVFAEPHAGRSRGAAGVWLGVNQQNARANRFYEKHGFERVGTKRFLVGDRWEDDFVRELVL